MDGPDQNGPKHLQVTITRATFESLAKSLLARLVEPCRTALKAAGLSAGGVGEVVGFAAAC